MIIFISLPSYSQIGTIWRVALPESYDKSKVSVTSDNCYPMGNFLRFSTKISSAVFTFELDKGDYSKAKLLITDSGTAHLIEAARDQTGTGVYSPYSIIVNGTKAANVDVLWIDFSQRTYNVGSFLKAGTNTITIQLDIGARTRYDLREVILTM